MELNPFITQKETTASSQYTRFRYTSAHMKVSGFSGITSLDFRKRCHLIPLFSITDIIDCYNWMFNTAQIFILFYCAELPLLKVLTRSVCFTGVAGSVATVLHDAVMNPAEGREKKGLSPFQG